MNYLTQQAEHIDAFLAKETHRGEAERLGLAKRLVEVQQQLEQARDGGYLKKLEGTLGRDSSL